MSSTLRPPYDSELGAMLTAIADQFPPEFTREMIPTMRTMPEPGTLSEEDLDKVGVTGRDVVIPGHLGGDITVSVYARKDHQGPGGFHGSDMLAPDNHLSRRAFAARTAWVDRLLNG